MTNQNEPQVSRRGFLKAITVTGAAAIAAGAGAAALKQKPEAPATITTAAATAPLAIATPVAATAPQDEILARLAAAQAENMRLQAALDAANRQLATYQLQNQDSSAAAEALNVQLSEANAQISVLAGLVALYEQLEEIDVETVVENGLTAVSAGAVTWVTAVAPPCAAVPARGSANAPRSKRAIIASAKARTTRCRRITS